MSLQPDFTDELTHVLDQAKRQGATQADAIAFCERSITHRRRNNLPELTEASDGQAIGVRVFIDKQQTVLSTNDLRKETLDRMVENAIAATKLLPANPYCGLGDNPTQAPDADVLDLNDPTELDGNWLQEQATIAENTALENPAITNSEGADASCSRGFLQMANSLGYSFGFPSTSVGVSVAVIAGEGETMQVDYASHSVVHAEDLESPAAIGARAAERAVAALNPRKVPTCEVPVIFSTRVSSSLIGHIAQALNGRAQVESASFLLDSIGREILPTSVSITENPFLPRGHGSRPIDGEFVVGTARSIIDQGVVNGYFLDLASARKLGTASTGSAVRGVGSVPSPRAANLTMSAGTQSEEDLIKSVKSGLYVTSLMGMGVNVVSGDYSQGAQGFWIENGECTFAVAEVTIAGDLLTMLKEIVVADNLRMRRRFNAPSILIPRMTVAGA
ncbi:MAG: TldD/PmbA family protein [Alphaproteobacteria bacterium]|nr:TldD/PmbA family protein [Alphaproteobacteria bacterium]